MTDHIDPARICMYVMGISIRDIMRPREPSMPSSVQHLYENVVEAIRHDIATGRLAPGDRLASVRDLSRSYGVSKITAQRAVAELKSEGLVRTAGARGTFIAGLPAVDQDADPAAEVSRIVVVGTRVAEFDRDSFYGSVVASIAEHARRRRLDMRIEQVSSLALNPVEDSALRPRQGDGFIVLHPRPTLPMLALVLDKRLPSVLVDAVVPGAVCVATDNVGGMRDIVAHLVALGHRRTVLAVGFRSTPNPTNAHERRDAFVAMAHARGMRVDVVNDTDYGHLHALLGTSSAPTAFAFTRDLPAVEFIQQARERGYRVPEDFSVTGFDGYVDASLDADSLTTIGVDREELARQAVEGVVDLPRRFPRVCEYVRVPGVLQVRGSTAAARNCGSAH